ncbi:MAG TPA: HAMP domain-containing sensor histidine kinase [Anaeromyxobacter sp.]
MHDALDDTLSRIGALDADLVAPSLLHELRQPLMGADASARLLERAFGAALARDDEWRVLRAQLERLGEILLEYEGLLRATDEAPSRYAVGPVVARSVALLAHRVRPLARRFGLAREEGDCEGFGDPGALVHAATNVLANALDAVEGVAGEPRVHVRVLAAPRGGVEVRVSDEGIGIAHEHRARLFEARFTTKAPGRGTGLGLHLSRRLMARHGGGVFLVPERDPARLAWAVTEFCIAVPPPPAGGGP